MKHSGTQYITISRKVSLFASIILKLNQRTPPTGSEKDEDMSLFRNRPFGSLDGFVGANTKLLEKKYGHCRL